VGKIKAELNPFTKRDFDELKRMERRLTDMLPILDRAESCGVECQTFREVVQEFLRRFGLFESNFFTPPPTK